MSHTTTADLGNSAGPVGNGLRWVGNGLRRVGNGLRRVGSTAARARDTHKPVGIAFQGRAGTFHAVVAAFQPGLLPRQ